MKPIKITQNDLRTIVSESVKKILNENTGKSPIELWNFWCTNYDYDFIQKAWANDPNMAHHLQNKFDSYYDVAGSYGVMTKFYLNLDGTNREILENYVLNNFRG
jgi:hypothetical protein